MLLSIRKSLVYNILFFPIPFPWLNFLFIVILLCNSTKRADVVEDLVAAIEVNDQFLFRNRVCPFEISLPYFPSNCYFFQSILQA